jgi:hypothetical protein
MPRTLTPIIAGCAAVAAVVFAAPKPASATAATPAVHYGETHAGMVQQVGRRYWRRHGYPYVYGYGYPSYGYGYRPYGYYRPYAYYGGPYYRPYAYYGGPYGYYGGPYGYYGRPGISFSFGF